MVGDRVYDVDGGRAGSEQRAHLVLQDAGLHTKVARSVSAEVKDNGGMSRGTQTSGQRVERVRTPAIARNQHRGAHSVSVGGDRLLPGPPRVRDDDKDERSQRHHNRKHPSPARPETADSQPHPVFVLAASCRATTGTTYARVRDPWLNFRDDVGFRHDVEACDSATEPKLRPG